MKTEIEELTDDEIRHRIDEMMPELKSPRADPATVALFWVFNLNLRSNDRKADAMVNLAWAAVILAVVQIVLAMCK